MHKPQIHRGVVLFVLWSDDYLLFSNSVLTRSDAGAKLDTKEQKRYNEILNGIKTSTGHTVKSIPNHACMRAVQRKISVEAIKDARQNPWATTPVRIDKSGKPSMKFYGNEAIVAYNPTKECICTVWKKEEVE